MKVAFVGLLAAMLLASCTSAPTATPAPTYTPLPTYTPAPTYTPYPTPTATTSLETLTRQWTIPDERPVVYVADGGTGTVDHWDVTASFAETRPFGYAKRQVVFNVRIEWMGEEPGGESMGYNFLESAMRLVSPSGKGAGVGFRDIRYEGDDLGVLEGIALNGSTSLPDEEGTFYLFFGPHQNKHVLVWTVDLPYLPLE